MTTVTLNSDTESTFSSNYSSISLASGSLLVTGSYDTLFSGISNVGITLNNVENLMILSGNNDSITAGQMGSYGDSILETGNYNTIDDEGFGGGNGITLAGSYNTLSSNQRQESTNVLISGNNNIFDNAYLLANMTISGDNNTVNIGNDAILTISGNYDTITALDAKTIIVTGIGDVINDNYLRDEPVPEGFATSSSEPASVISVSGSGNSLNLETNNISVSSNADNTTINSAGDLATINASGSGTVLDSNALLDQISVSGGNSTITTKTSQSEQSNSTTIAATNVVLSGDASVGTVYNNGYIPPTLAVTTSGQSINTLLYSLVTDEVGNNTFAVGGASSLNDIAGNDTININDYSYILNDSISGDNGSNTINFGSNDIYQGSSTSFVSSKNILNLNPNDAAVIYSQNQDTVNVIGSNSTVILEDNNQVTDVAKQSVVGGSSSINVDGNSTGLVETSNNSIMGSNGATLFVGSGNNTVNGNGVTAQISGQNNTLVFTGSDTVLTSNPLQEQQRPGAIAQSNMSIESGNFSVNGYVNLDQTEGSANIDLYGPNNVSINGSNDVISLTGDSSITNNGTGNVFNVNSVNFSQTTINASKSSLVDISDNTGSIIGGPNNNINEGLDFIASSGTQNIIFGGNSKTAVTLFGGQSSGNIVYGGNTGNNSLNGGSGSNNFFQAGGDGDVLIGGSGGSNTLVSGLGNETLVGSNVGNDSFSISGGGGTDVIQDFTGTLTINSGLTVQSEQNVMGSLLVTLSDQTKINFIGMTNITSNGNVFTAR
jgi:hypothetical protein